MMKLSLKLKKKIKKIPLPIGHIQSVHVESKVSNCRSNTQTLSPR